MIDNAYAIAACHFLGDYVLYTVPFAVVFGIDWRIWLLLLSHFTIDELKEHGRIGYVLDQSWHLLAALPYMWG